MQENKLAVSDQDGFLLVNKPAGMTSHDAVAIVRRARGVKKIGHAGTLDPMATGLLILGIGKATKRLGTLIGLPKTYEAEITLGATTNTDDAQGIISNIQFPISNEISNDKILVALKKFIGEIKQVPPVFSAIQIKGQRAYKIARRGEIPDLKPRKITIHDIKIESDNYPLLSIYTHVGSGTYIRALARDLGKALGTGAYLSKLVRTSIGEYKLKQAIELNDAGKAPLSWF